MKTLIAVSNPARITSFSSQLIEKGVLAGLDLRASEKPDLKSAGEIFFSSFHPPDKEHLRKMTSETDADLSFLIYGNFTEMAPYWQGIEGILQGKRVMFYALSVAHQRFMKQFLGADHVQILRPAEIPGLRFDSSERTRVRRLMRIPESGKAFIYSGRISFQKQIHTLLSAFHYHAEMNPLDQLWVVGMFDDLGDPYFNVNFLYGHYEQRLHGMMTTLPKSIRERIHFIPFQKRKTLAALYSAADVAVSLSTHHDEDFGVSLFEAHQCGLPMICSGWGGHLDLSQRADFLRVKASGKDRTLELEEIIASLAKPRERETFVKTQRPQLSKAQKFSGFPEELTKLSMLAQRKTLFSEELEYYKYIYRSYYGEMK